VSGLPARPALRRADDEPDQVPRLLAFRAAHPEVIIGDGGFGTWQARIPEPDGEGRPSLPGTRCTSYSTGWTS